MKFRQCGWASLLAAFVLAALGVSEGRALAQRRVFVVTPGFGYYPVNSAYPYYPTYYNYYYYTYSTPYVMPLPAYGILPMPLAPMNMLNRSGAQRTAENYGYQIDTPARKRTSLYP